MPQSLQIPWNMREGFPEILTVKPAVSDVRPFLGPGIFHWFPDRMPVAKWAPKLALLTPSHTRDLAAIVMLFKTVVKCTSHKIDHLSPFKVYSSVMLSTFTWLCNQSPGLFSICKTETLSPLNNSFSVLLAPAPGSHCCTFCL